MGLDAKGEGAQTPGAEPRSETQLFRGGPSLSPDAQDAVPHGAPEEHPAAIRDFYSNYEKLAGVRQGRGSQPGLGDDPRDGFRGVHGPLLGSSRTGPYCRFANADSLSK